MMTIVLLLVYMELRHAIFLFHQLNTVDCIARLVTGIIIIISTKVLTVSDATDRNMDEL